MLSTTPAVMKILVEAAFGFLTGFPSIRYGFLAAGFRVGEYGAPAECFVCGYCVGVYDGLELIQLPIVHRLDASDDAWVKNAA